MSYRLERQGNYIRLIEQSTGEPSFERPSKDLTFRDEPQYGKVSFFYGNPNVPIGWRDGYTIGSTAYGIDQIEDFVNPSYAQLVEWLERNTGGIIPTDSTNTPSIGLGAPWNDIKFDAWGRQKMVQDKSLFSSLFTHNVPVSKWKESADGVELLGSFSKATSHNGKLVLTSGALDESIVLDSFETPRYEPNRGHLYSTAGFFPNPDAQGIRRWGVATIESGVFFELNDIGLYAVVRSFVNGLVTEDRKLIDTTGFDLSKGNTYDCQFQWRGVGNYVFYIDLKEAARFDYLGTKTELSTFNPALPAMFECINKGDEVTIEIGCVDVTTEGGTGNGATYGSLPVPTLSGDLPLNGYNCPALIVHNKSVLASGRLNTRLVKALLITAYSDSKGFLRVWVTRDSSAFTLNDQSWTDYGDGHLEYIWFNEPTVATPVAFDTAKAVNTFGCRLQANETYESSAVFGADPEIKFTAGDYLVFTIHKDNGQLCNGGCTFEFLETI